MLIFKKNLRGVLAHYVSLGTIPNIIQTLTPPFLKAGSTPENKWTWKLRNRNDYQRQVLPERGQDHEDAEGTQQRMPT